jgi:hypothetical protein
MIMKKKLRSTVLYPALAALALLACGTPFATAQDEPGISRFAGEEKPPSFDDSATLIDEFRKAVAANDLSSVARLLGLNVEALLDDEASLETFIKIHDGMAEQLVLDEKSDTIVLEIGKQLWPFPFPIIRDDNGTWSFDTYSGLDEILDRRIGQNELEAIATAHAYVGAQHDYALADHDGDGVLEYAQKLISSEGLTDGLYWPYSPEAGVSPAGDFANKESIEKARLGQGYFGYRYKILTGQGDNVAGGGYDYVINGNMIAGFGLIAWPVNYAETGVKTFMVNQHGTVYETDLGPETGTIVKYIDSFNPDESWSVVAE